MNLASSFTLYLINNIPCRSLFYNAIPHGREEAYKTHRQKKKRANSAGNIRKRENTRWGSGWMYGLRTMPSAKPGPFFARLAEGTSATTSGPISEISQRKALGTELQGGTEYPADSILCLKADPGTVRECSCPVRNSYGSRCGQQKNEI